MHYFNQPKIETVQKMSPEDVESITNREDPDQTAPIGGHAQSDLGFAVYPGLQGIVRNRIITVQL